MELVVRLVSDPDYFPKQELIYEAVRETAAEENLDTTMGPGAAIEVGVDNFIDFSPEPPGLQVGFDGDFSKDFADRLAQRLKNVFAAESGKSAEFVWYRTE